jgi:tetratricopeptide (TPR) repeat protein
LLGALVGGISALMDVAPPRERLTLNLQAASLAQQLGDRERLLRTHMRICLDHAEMGEFGAAAARIDAFETLARELSAPWFQWRAPVLRSMLALVHGRFAEAEAQVAEAREVGAASGDTQLERVLVMHRQGQLRAAERHDEMLQHNVMTRQYWTHFGAGDGWQWIAPALAASRVEDAEATARNLARVPEGWLPSGDNVYALFYAAEPVAFAGTEADAENIYQMQLPAADRDVLLGATQQLWEGPVARLLGLLSARRGRWDEASGHFEAAIDRARRLDAAPILCRTRYEYARALQQRGDRDRARDLLREARPDAERLPLPGLLCLIDRRLEQLGGVEPAPSPVRAPGPTAPAASGGLPFSMVREGEYWAVAYQGATFRLKDSLGLRYLERLVAQPEQEIHVLELAGGRDASGGEPAGATIDAGDAGELLDPEARESYRRRLEDLREEMAEAEAAGDGFRASRAREEIEFLGAELSRAVGLGGRGRRAGGAAERARSAVQRRIRNALDRIAEHAPGLTSYLEQAIKTGTFCIYRPPPPPGG